MSKIVLVVDDDRLSLELVRRKLEEHGYETMTAADGESALAQLNQKKPDLIVLDVEMPKMNGYTFITEKKKNPAFANIPVIMLTSHQETKPLFQRYNVRAYLIKPLNIEELLNKVAQYITPAA